LRIHRALGCIAQERNSERHPPGDEIYRKDNISMFEVDGSKNKMYCQVSIGTMDRGSEASESLRLQRARSPLVFTVNSLSPAGRICAFLRSFS
jgi:hypothetical protein